MRHNDISSAPMIHNACAAIAMLLSFAASGASLTGTVVYVVDGDTLDVADGSNRTMRVRLGSVDSPELRQRHGYASRIALQALCLDAPAKVETYGTDRYGRTIGDVSCRGVDAGRELVRKGGAWVYDRYATDQSLYVDQEAAQAAQRGLWADDKPTAPWLFRRAVR